MGWWRSRPERLALAGIVLFAVAVRVLGLTSGLPDWNRFFWDSDEGAIINTAMAMGSGDLDPHTFFQPSLVFYVLLAVYGLFYLAGRLSGRFVSTEDLAVLYFNDPTEFYVLGRLLMITLGVATIVVVFVVARARWGARTALLAAAMLAVVPIHVTFSQLVKVDVPATLLAVLAVGLTLRALDRGTARTYALAGAVAGLAASSKYQAGFVIAGIAAVAAIRSGSDPRGWRREFAALAVAAIATATGFVAGTPFSILDAPAFVSGITGLGELEADPGLGTPAGVPAEWWASYATLLADPRALGLPLALVAAIGVIVAVGRRRTADLVLLAAAAPTYLFLSLPVFTNRNPQFLLPAIPILLILGAHAIDLGVRRMTPNTGAFALIAALILAPAAGMSAALSADAARTATTREARLWIERNVPAGSTILIDRRQVPQLSFTMPALEERRAYRDATELLPSKRETLGIEGSRRSRLASLKDAALTGGIAYDLIVILEPRDQVLPPERDLYEVGFRAGCERFRPGYAVLSSWIVDAYARLRPRSEADARAISRRFAFYEDVRAHADVLATFAPDARHAGPTISVLRIRGCDLSGR